MIAKKAKSKLTHNVVEYFLVYSDLMYVWPTLPNMDPLQATGKEGAAVLHFLEMQ